MRILHIGKYYPPVEGGMERFLGDLVQAQRAAGDEAAVLVHADGRTLPGGDPPWLHRCPVWVKLLFAPVSPGFARRLSKAIALHDPEVLHLHLPNPSAFWALALPAARRLPWVVHWHSDVEPSKYKLSLRLAYPFYRLFERALLERADCVIPTSQAYLEASRPLRLCHDKCLVVPLGLAPGRLPEVPPQASQGLWQGAGLRALAVGRLTYYKGFETLVAACARTPGVELVIAGEGEERVRLEKAWAAAGRPATVRLAGAVDDATLCALMASCDVLCLPSRERTEAFGVVLMEAMRYGKALLVSRLAGSGMTWVAADGVNGLHAAPEDVAAWSGALARLAAEPALRERLGRAGQARFHAEFDIARIAREVGRAYRFARASRAVEAPWQAAELAQADTAGEPGERAFAPKGSGRTLLVIPALNESACIAQVLQEARRHVDADILLVDDGSTDGTPALARAEGARVLQAPLWQGAWGAMQTGLRYAVRHGYESVITMDADGQHEPQFLPALLAAGREADVVIAACPSRGSRLRHIAWRYFRLLTGFRIEDLTSGFRFYNARACRLLAQEEATLLDYQDIGVLLLLRHANLRIAEIAVEMSPRRDGASRVFSSWLTVGRYMAETSLLCLARWNRAPGKP